jgi:hypothetical protein
MNKYSEYCQLKRKYAGWSVSAIVICVLAGSFTGCSTLESYDSQVSNEERLKAQAELKASLVAGDENIEQKNTSVEKDSLIEEASQPVIFGSGDLAGALNWLGDVFSWSDSSPDADKAVPVAEDAKVTKSEAEILVYLNSQSPAPNIAPIDETAFEAHSNNKQVLIENTQKLEIASSENLDTNSAIEETALTEDIAITEESALTENIITKEEPVLTENIITKEELVLTEVIVAKQDSDVVTSLERDNENIIAAINALTIENPSAAGIPTETMEQEVSARIQSEKTVAQSESESFIKPLVKTTAEMKAAWHECALSTPTIELESPDYTTQMWLNVYDDRIMVNTTTNIDINMKQVGVKVDNGKLQKFSGKLYASNVVWSADVQSLFKNNKSLKIFIGGDELGRNRQAAEISMAELKALYKANTNCSK